MVRSLVVAAAFSLCLAHWPGSAIAGGVAGNSLKNFCSSTTKFFDGVCFGYVIGVVHQTVHLARDLGTSPPFCISDEVAPAQMVDVAKNFMQRYPETLHRPAANIVTAAMIEAFPCR